MRHARIVLLAVLAGLATGCTGIELPALGAAALSAQFDLRTGAPMGDATEGLKGYPLKEKNGELYVALGG